MPAVGCGRSAPASSIISPGRSQIKDRGRFPVPGPAGGPPARLISPSTRTTGPAGRRTDPNSGPAGVGERTPAIRAGFGPERFGRGLTGPAPAVYNRPIFPPPLTPPETDP